MSEVVLFTCDICKMPFDVPQGGRCKVCGLIVCRSHLYLAKDGLICSNCVTAKKLSDLPKIEIW